MGEPRTVKRGGGGLALEVEALKIAGATAGQVLTFQSDGAGGVEGVPAAAAGGGATVLGDLEDIGPMGKDIAQATTVTEVVTAMGGASAVRTALDAPQDVFTTRGDLMRGGAGGVAERFAASAADTFVGGDGTDVTARTAAQVRASILGPFADPMTGAGWSANTPSGSATATWGSSKLACVCPSGSAASCGTSQAAYLASGEWYDIAARIQVIAGNGSSATRVGLIVGASSSSNVSINLWTSGTVECGHYDGVTFTSLAFPAATSSGDRTGGELWLRISRTPTSVAFAWGVGSGGALPTAWNVIHVSTNATVLLRATGKRAELFALTTGSFQFEVDFLAVNHALPGGF